MGPHGATVAPLTADRRTAYSNHTGVNENRVFKCRGFSKSLRIKASAKYFNIKNDSRKA